MFQSCQPNLNIVFILADDAGLEISRPMVANTASRPNIDRLAAEGMKSPAPTAVMRFVRHRAAL